MNGVMPLGNPIQLYLGLKAGPKVFGYINEWLHFSINANKADDNNVSRLGTVCKYDENIFQIKNVLEDCIANIREILKREKPKQYDSYHHPCKLWKCCRVLGISLKFG